MKDARALALSEPVLESAIQRYATVRDLAEREMAKQARRESLGLGSLTTPNEFLCPVTQDVMVDPVVASDGHSYERVAIQAILDRGCSEGGSALSPLTRETLEPALIPNINLRKRIREHDSEVESVARQVIRSMTGHIARKATSPTEGLSNSPRNDGLLTGQCSRIEVADALQRFGLQRYAVGFEEHGYDSWDEVLAMRPQQIEKLVTTIAMASNHADRFRAAVSRTSQLRHFSTSGKRAGAESPSCSRAASVGGKRSGEEEEDSAPPRKSPPHRQHPRSVSRKSTAVGGAALNTDERSVAGGSGRKSRKLEQSGGSR